MEFITGAILSGIVYDMMKHQVVLSADNIRNRLKGWVVDDSPLELIEQELNELKLSNQLSELAIKEKMESSEKLLSLLSEVKKDATSVIQTHSGSGDNVAGDKNINYK